MNDIERVARNLRQEARKEILRVANRNLTSSRTLTMKNLQEAAAIVRDRRLIDPAVLVAAGFNPERRK